VRPRGLPFSSMRGEQEQTAQASAQPRRPASCSGVLV
jgi:hypothetical protein